MLERHVCLLLDGCHLLLRLLSVAADTWGAVEEVIGQIEPVVAFGVHLGRDHAQVKILEKERLCDILSLLLECPYLAGFVGGDMVHGNDGLTPMPDAVV